MQRVAELVSLYLTWPTIVLGLGVVLFWGRAALRAKTVKVKSRTEVDWLILGICVGFAGSCIDNFYWGLAWTANVLNHESADWWFQTGAYPNIIFRQMAGIYSAYCHLRGYYASGTKTPVALKNALAVGFILGMVYALSLTYLILTNK